MLEIDLGNTLLKWRVLDMEGRVKSRGREQCDPLLAREMLNDWQGCVAARISSVSSAARNEQVARYLSVHGIVAHFARVDRERAGVTCVYEDHSRLGIDRWLAMLAAYHRSGCRAVAVIDAGSAITLDLVSEAGAHLGGLIMPGFGLMQRALYKDTAAVKAPPIELLRAPELGVSTESCVLQGFSVIACGVVSQIRTLAAQHGVERFYLTGGDGLLLEELLPEAEWVEELVMDGLVWEAER